MKRYIRSSQDIKSGSYMISKDGDIIPVYFHAPSTTYIDRHIYHLCPTDADFLMSQKQISEDDAKVVVAYCLAEYLEDKNVKGEISSKDIDGFVSYADLAGAPMMYMIASEYEGSTIDKLEKDSKSFDSLNSKWYKWLKNNFVKCTFNNNKLEFRIGSDNGYDWNDVIIDDVILKSNLKDNSSVRYNILRESDKGYKAYFQNATLDQILEDDKAILSEEVVSSTNEGTSMKRMSRKINASLGSRKDQALDTLNMIKDIYESDSSGLLTGGFYDDFMKEVDLQISQIQQTVNSSSHIRTRR